jgi:hypothetical protein
MFTTPRKGRSGSRELRTPQLINTPLEIQESPDSRDNSKGGLLLPTDSFSTSSSSSNSRLFAYLQCLKSARMMVLVVLCLQNSMFTLLRRYSQGVLRETYSKVRTTTMMMIYKVCRRMMKWRCGWRNVKLYIRNVKVGRMILVTKSVCQKISKLSWSVCVLQNTFLGGSMKYSLWPN